jgi:hypothetical protein
MQIKSKGKQCKGIDTREPLACDCQMTRRAKLMSNETAQSPNETRNRYWKKSNDNATKQN